MVERFTKVVKFLFGWSVLVILVCFTIESNYDAPAVHEVMHAAIGVLVLSLPFVLIVAFGGRPAK